MTDDLDTRSLRVAHAPLEAVNKEERSRQPLVGLHCSDLRGRAHHAVILLSFHLPRAEEDLQAFVLRSRLGRLLLNLGVRALCGAALFHGDFSFGFGLLASVLVLKQHDLYKGVPLEVDSQSLHINGITGLNDWAPSDASA